jgi:nitrogen regulatory protein PII
MKYLVITAIREYETDVKRILNKCKVQTFSLHEIAGYKTRESAAETPHWFAGDESHTTQSVMFYVFASAEMAECVFKEVNHANSKQEFESKIHLVSLNVEQSNIQ